MYALIQRCPTQWPWIETHVYSWGRYATEGEEARAASFRRRSYAPTVDVDLGVPRHRLEWAIARHHVYHEGTTVHGPI